MKVPFILDGDDVVLDAEPDEKLINILRDSRNFSVKCGCNTGSCGSCTVLLDDKPVPSCLVTAAAVRDCEVITLEAFKKTDDWKDIETGFRQNDVHLCGYCDAGKIFAVYELIRSEQRPSKDEIVTIMKQFPCKCCDAALLANSVMIASAAYRKRMGMHHGQ